MSRIGDSISNAVRTIVMVAVAAAILLVGWMLGQRTAGQQSQAEIARIVDEKDAALAAAEEMRETAAAEAEAQVSELSAELEALRSEVASARATTEAAAQAGRPYAGIGAESCEAFLATDGFEGDPRREQLLEWASGFASGINVGRQMSGAEAVGLEPVGEIDFPAEIARYCEETDAETLAGAVVQVLAPAFRDISGEADQ